MSATGRYRMVVALDDSEYSEIVLEQALDLAARHDKVDLHFVRVVGDESDIVKAGRQLATRLLAAVDTIRDEAGERRARIHIRVGDIVDEIVRVAADHDADILVVGRFGAHSRHRSFASAIVDAAPCPTLIVGLAEHAVEHPGDPPIHSLTLSPFVGASYGRIG